MSNQTVIYILYGVMLPFKAIDTEEDDGAKVDPYRDNAFKPESVNAKGNVTYIADNMGAGWAAVGHVVERSDEYGNYLANTVIDGAPNAEWDADIDRALADMEAKDAADVPKCWHVITNYR